MRYLNEYFNAIDLLTLHGVLIGGENFFLLRKINDESLLFKRDSVGCHVQRTKKAIIFATFEDPNHPSQSFIVTQNLAKYLVSINY